MANQAEAKNKPCFENLPNQTSSWASCPEEIYKLYKVRLRVVNPEKIIWPGNLDNINLHNWFLKLGGASSAYYDVYFDYLDQVFQKLDIDEAEWYEGKTLKELDDNAEQMFAVILKAMREYPDCNNIRKKDIVRDLLVMSEKIMDWLSILRTLLEMNMSDIPESSFEEMFRFFISILGLSCHRGDCFAKLKFHLEDKGVVNSVSSEPGLFICSKKDIVKRFTVAVVEVQKGSKQTKQESVTVSDEETVASSATLSVQDHPCSLLKSDYPNATIRLLTDGEKKACSAFLPQLLGVTLAALNSNDVKLHSLPLQPEHLAIKSVIGFGVVGFNVYVVNFLFVRRDMVPRGSWNMHDIPLIKGMGTDILICEPLNLLKRNDRNTLFRLISALKSTEFGD